MRILPAPFGVTSGKAWTIPLLGLSFFRSFLHLPPLRTLSSDDGRYIPLRISSLFLRGVDTQSRLLLQ